MIKKKVGDPVGEHDVALDDINLKVNIQEMIKDESYYDILSSFY